MIISCSTTSCQTPFFGQSWSQIHHLKLHCLDPPKQNGTKMEEIKSISIILESAFYSTFSSHVHGSSVLVSNFFLRSWASEPLNHQLISCIGNLLVTWGKYFISIGMVDIDLVWRVLLALKPKDSPWKVNLCICMCVENVILSFFVFVDFRFY